MKAVLLGAMLLMPTTALAAPGATLFNERCAICHTIGGGDQAGPDLVAAKRLKRQDLRAAVDRMQTNAGALTASDIDSLTAYLAGAVAQTAAAKPAPPRGNGENGRRLFFGDKAFAGGGTPCFACHAVEGRGGNLAADLTNSKVNVAAVAQQCPFPMMKACYGRHAVTEGEALDLAAYVAEAKSEKRERVGAVHGAAAGIAALGFAAVGFIVKRRRNEP